MPELPEVETIRRGLQALAVGRRVAGLRVIEPGSFHGAPSAVRALQGATVVKIERRAKVLTVVFDNGYCLVIHLKMTGQLVLVDPNLRGGRFGAGHPSRSLIGDLPDKSTRVVIELADGGRLFFNDQRKFGWMRLLPLAEAARLDFFKKAGPEPLSPGFSAAELAKRLARRPGSRVKAALLDQAVIAGIGNIYADESLFDAGVHPSRRVSSLSPDEVQALWRSIRRVLSLAIAKGGSTDRNYLNAEGRPGDYLKTAMVFRRQGQACRRCGGEVHKIKLAGRGTHFCPVCQIEDLTEQTASDTKVLGA